MSELRTIDEMGRKAAERFHRDQAKFFLEASINLCAASMPMRDVIRLLEDHAEMLREFG